MLFRSEVDGMDVMAVHASAQRAVERARRGEGPTLLECLTYRFRGHSLADPDELRSQLEKEFWAERDPIKFLSRQLLSNNLASTDDIAEIDQEINSIINNAVETAIEAPEPLSNELTNFVWA